MNQPQQSIETVKQAVDGVLGASAVSSPLWVGYIETGLTMFMLAGGALLLALRLFLTVKEIRKKAKED